MLAGQLTKFFLAHAIKDVPTARVPVIFRGFLQELGHADDLPVEVELQALTLFLTISAR